MQEENTIMKEFIIQETQEKKRVQQKLYEMENQIQVVFQAISESAESEEASLEEKMRKIVQTLQQYKDQIKKLEERAIPTTPLDVTTQRE
jgi:predicted nuclease with TOPRIM domain